MTAPKIKLGPNYSALCDTVEKHDPEAAKWMREEGARRVSVRANMTVAEFDPGNLIDAFPGQPLRKEDFTGAVLPDSSAPSPRIRRSVSRLRKRPSPSSGRLSISARCGG